jgi:hypothetical protein
MCCNEFRKCLCYLGKSHNAGEEWVANLVLWVYIHPAPSGIEFGNHMFKTKSGNTKYHARTHTHTHTHTHTYTHTQREYIIHTHIHMHIHTHVHTYIHTCIHTYVHTYIHTYIHTYYSLSILPIGTEASASNDCSIDTQCH